MFSAAVLSVPATTVAQSYRILHLFTSDGVGLSGALIQATDGNFYGTTSSGGTQGYGTVFRMDPLGNVTTLHDFMGSDGMGSDGAFPSAGLIQANDGNFYGTTNGENPFTGTVFKINSSGNFTTLHRFNGSDGANPYGRLIQAGDGNFYGTTSGGGTPGYGTVFKVDPSGSLTTLHSFACSDGGSPYAGLIQATDGNFYGTTRSCGGTGGEGTAFRMDSSGNVTTLHTFTGSDGATPWAALIQANDGNFYGTTAEGGTHNVGTIFKMDALGNVTTLHSFAGAPNDGRRPLASLLQASDNNFYGTTYDGGTHNDGTVFRVDSSGNLTILHAFDVSDGYNPFAGLIQTADGSFYGTTDFGGARGYGTVFKMDSLGNLVTLKSFGFSGGLEPNAGLVQATDGNLYGTTYAGGANHAGTIFRMDSIGNLTTLHNFVGAPSGGANPNASLLQAADGNFYGTTEGGGAEGSGTVFKMDSLGNVTTLHSFDGDDGANPEANLIQATDGNFYGTTSGGRSISGTVFKMDSSGNLTTLHRFPTSATDGASPAAGLVQAADGNFYGTTAAGGTNDVGTIFKIDPLGNLTVVHSFLGPEGMNPYAGLIRGADGNFYGTTYYGGSELGSEGTAFRMDSAGNVTTLHQFTVQGGGNPSAMIQASDGTFYGTTSYGGGTIFKMDSAGSVSTLHTFTGSDGAYPSAGLIQATDGYFYGTTPRGGTESAGVVFRLVICSGPSVDVTAPSAVCPYSSSVPASVPDAGPGATYAWSVGNGIILSGVGTRSITLKAGPFGSVSLSVTVTDELGCSATGGGTIAIDPNLSCAAPVGFFTVTPCRVLDTRNTSGPYGGPALAAGENRSFVFAQRCGIPATATAVSLNVVAINPTTTGFLTLSPGGAAGPVISTINYNSGNVRANNAIISLGAAGDIAVHCGQGSGSADLVIDVNGYFQ